MVYMGSKNRIARYLLPIILSSIKPNQWYIEPFCGGCNMIDKVRHPLRMASDNNKYLIALFKELQNGWIPDKYYGIDDYEIIKRNKDDYPDYVVGYLGFVCSFSSIWFSGFCGNGNMRNDGSHRNDQEGKRNSLIYQIHNLKEIKFYLSEYDKLDYPPNSIIYCDPPYEDTTSYHSEFNHVEFWQWCRNMSKEGHTVFISEYNAPSDFECIWEHSWKNKLSRNITTLKTEKLFTYGHIEPTWNIQLKLF